jgi:hypothetical protein
MPKKAQFLSLVLTILIAGCGGGGDGKDSDSKSAAPPADAAQQDATAKGAAREFVTELEACYVDSQSYASCPKGSGSVTATGTDDGYVVTSRSESGNAFAIAKVGGAAAVRTCTAPGKGGCPASGEW